MKNHFVILTAVDSSSVTSLLLDTIGKYLYYLHYLHFSRNERHFLTLLVEIFHGSGGNISTAQNSITGECKIPVWTWLDSIVSGQTPCPTGAEQ